ncbi:hypothetical protein [Saccharothrix xinjiangensis]|uniref:Uncharacterized protein n=1 Tax=Saccharothrix xinjiangensis TaxID=204798 RepID=A0ABV9XW20_9PSEU
MTTIQDESELADLWTAPELGHKLIHDPQGPETDAWALRVLAARVAAHAGKAGDPRAIVYDVGKALESLASAVSVAMKTEADDPECGSEAAAAAGMVEQAGLRVFDLERWF